MVKAKVIGVIMLLTLGIPISYSEDAVLYEPTYPVEEAGNPHGAPASANDGQQNQGKESVPQLEQDSSLHLKEDTEASGNLSVIFTEQNSSQSLDPSSVLSRQNEGSGNTFILPYVRRSGSAADLLHLIQRSRGLPSPSEISGTFYTLNILPPDLDKSYEPVGVQVNPTQSQELSHQPLQEFSGISLSQGSETFYESEGQAARDAENNEPSNDTIQEKQLLSNADSTVLEQYEEVSQNLPDLDKKKSLASKKREIDISTSSGETSLGDQNIGVLQETQIKAQEYDTPQKFGNSHDPTSEEPTIPALHKPDDYAEEVYVTNDWLKALEITQPVTISTTKDSVQQPQDRTQELDTFQNSGIISSPSTPTQDKLGSNIINNVAEKLMYSHEDPEAIHQPETQGKLASFEHPHLQPKPLVATVHTDTESTIQNLSGLAEIPYNSDTARNIGEKLAGIVSDYYNNESQKILINIDRKVLDDSKLVPLDLSHLSSEGHSLFVEVLPLDTELQGAGGISSADEELRNQTSADTQSYYNTHSTQLPETIVSSSIQREQVIHTDTEIPIEPKSVSPVNTGSHVHSPIESSNEAQTVFPPQRDQLANSPASKDRKEAALIPPSPTIRQTTYGQDHSINEGQLTTRIPENSQEPNLDSHNDKIHHRDLSIEGRALSGPYESEVSTASTSRHPEKVMVARQPRRSRGGLTPLFTPPETREDLKDVLPHSSAEEEKVATPYQFSYNVKDPSKGADFGHQEGSDGKTVKGQYFVVLPDGRRQTVQYQADHVNGYQSEVEYHPQEVPSGGIIRGDAFSLEHIFTRGKNKNLLDLGSNNNVNNQYQQEVLQKNDVLNQGAGDDYQQISNEEALNPHQDVGSVDFNDLPLQLPEHPFQASSDQYQIPVDNQFQQLSPENQHGLITDHNHFKESGFDDQFNEQDIFDQPAPHSETNQYQSLNGGPNFRDDFGGGEFPLPNNGDQFHPVEEDQFEKNDQFLQHDGNIHPSVDFNHQPNDDADQSLAGGENPYQLVSNEDQLFPFSEGNQHQFQDNGNQDQPLITRQYQNINGNEHFVLQNEGDPLNSPGGNDRLQVNEDFSQFPHSSENSPAQYNNGEPLNTQSGSVPILAQADDSEFHSLIHGGQSQPLALNEGSFGTQSRSDPVESQSITVPIPSRTSDLQTQPFLSPSVIPTTEDHDLNPGYYSSEYDSSIEASYDQAVPLPSRTSDLQTQLFLSPSVIPTSGDHDLNLSYNSNEYDSSIEATYDQTQIPNELESVARENFPQRRDVHNQNKTLSQVVPSIDHQSNTTFNDSQEGYDDFHDYDGSGNPQETIETESNQHFEDEVSPIDDFSSESFQTEEVLHENVERNSFQGERLVHDIPEDLEGEKLYSESSDS
ncbi:uncharacterized protein [Palaemon carinicauda]|uniref:uncharacterized protein n=1 Tax=Palaemon carinicauda TaxID=392227 RepID=UPI0035B5B087